MKDFAIRCVDRAGLGAPARRFTAHLRDLGLLPWKPLVPEAAFSGCVRHALRELRRLEPVDAIGDYLEFGVSRGTSMACVFRVLQEEGLHHTRLIGFDSFEGMPPEAAGQGWRPGEFRSTIDATRRYLAARDVDFGRVTLVKGWFKDTLTPETRTRLSIGKASLIMIDCDIYTASKEALTFCEPHIHERAIVVFDDWRHGAEEGHSGQKRALGEFLAEHPTLGADPLPAYTPDARVFLVTRRPPVGG